MCLAIEPPGEIPAANEFQEMDPHPSPGHLMASLARALVGNTSQLLLAASIELSLDSKAICIRFEYEGEPDEDAREASECAASEVISDFWRNHDLEVLHVAVPAGHVPAPLSNLSFRR